MEESLFKTVPLSEARIGTAESTALHSKFVLHVAVGNSFYSFASSSSSQLIKWRDAMLLSKQMVCPEVSLPLSLESIISDEMLLAEFKAFLAGKDLLQYLQFLLDVEPLFRPFVSDYDYRTLVKKLSANYFGSDTDSFRLYQNIDPLLLNPPIQATFENFMNAMIPPHNFMFQRIHVFNDAATTEIYSLSLHDALPI